LNPTNETDAEKRKAGNGGALAERRPRKRRRYEAGELTRAGIFAEISKINPDV